ncbi:tetratricopeptide repeat protein [Nocardia sp. NPDC003726]
MGEAPSPKKLEQVRSKGYPTPLRELLIRLLELSAEADFLHREAAALVEPGRVPKLHVQTGEGEWVVSSRLVSAQLNPRRDSPRPPSPELVEAFLLLYEQRGGPDPKAVRKQINTLYAAADHACREHKRLAAPPAPSRADLAALEQTIASLREEITARTAELTQLRSESERTHRADHDRVAALDAELTQLRAHLEEVSAERDELRTRQHKLSAEVERARDQLIRATAESDQQQARITELETTGPAPQSGVRQDPPPDSAGQKQVGQVLAGIEALSRIRREPAALLIVWMLLATGPVIAQPLRADHAPPMSWAWVVIAVLVYWLPLGYVVSRQYFPDPGLRFVRTRLLLGPSATALVVATGFGALVGISHPLAASAYAGVLIVPIFWLLFVGAGGRPELLGNPLVVRACAVVAVVTALVTMLGTDNFSVDLIVAAIATNLALMTLLARILEPDPVEIPIDKNTYLDEYEYLDGVSDRLHDLAHRRLSEKRAFTAITLFEKIATGTERARGRHDHSTRSAYSSLAFAYEMIGRHRAAIKLYKQILASHERVNGTEHSDAVFARTSLAYAYESANRKRSAVKLFERALRDNERTRDPGDPSTLASRNSLAGFYNRVGRTDEARALLEKNLADCQQFVGADASLTKSTTSMLRSLRDRTEHRTPAKKPPRRSAAKKPARRPR